MQGVSFGVNKKTDMRNTVALIDTSALLKNYALLRKEAGNGPVMAVVKANAYGHGHHIVVNALKNAPSPPECFGVATAEEAFAIRQCGFVDPIVLFEPLSRDNVDEIVKYAISSTIFDEGQLQLIKELSTRIKVKVHIKINTGMGRLGVHHSKAISFIKKTARMKQIEIEGIYSHFAESDNADNPEFTLQQLSVFTEIIKTLKKEGVPFRYAHMANSAALLTLPEARFDLVRPGIALYGYSPFGKINNNFGLSPVMTLLSKVETINKIRKGETVSYARRFVAPENGNVITVPIGYADGVPRRLTNRLTAVINGKAYLQSGTITMDRIMFYVGQDNVKAGDYVILFGGDNNGCLTAQDWSTILETIPYEITCGISQRVPRIQIDDTIRKTIYRSGH